MANPQQPVSRLKKYYVLRDHEEKNIGDWKQGDIVGVDPETAIPYIGANILTPLATAISIGIIGKTTPTPFKEKKDLHTFSAETTPASQSSKKTLAKNTLKDAVQAKKAASQPSEPEEEVILTDSAGEEVPTPPRELSEQEKAIQAKIAALKKAK